MLQKIYGLIFIIISVSCAQQSYYQEEALYQGHSPKNVNLVKPGYVWATAGKHYQRNAVYELFWGKHYRDVWAAPVQVPVLNLAHVYGGLVPSELGGGLQTTSLALLNPAGRTFTLRTLDKDPSKSLSPFLRKTFISNLMRDQTSAINPYGAFTLPPMAGAANIFHTNPQLYYVSANTAGLGKYHDSFKGKLVMLEEKFENKDAIVPAFGNAIDLINTSKLKERQIKSNLHLVDQMAYARARLFDVLISDFDRHEGQWNWAEYASDTTELIWYKPVPKDRDYAYYQYADGLIPWLLTRRILAGWIKPFIHNIPDVGGIIYKARELDREYLNQLSAAEWTQVARELKTALNEEVIQQAMSQFPDTVYQLKGKEIEQKLINRVAKLPQMADEFYKILAENVTVTGSDKKERFVVKKGTDESTLVQIYTYPDNDSEISKRIYQRKFYYPETKKITLKGLEDDDFMVDEKAKKGTEIIIDINDEKRKKSK